MRKALSLVSILMLISGAITLAVGVMNVSLFSSAGSGVMTNALGPDRRGGLRGAGAHRSEHLRLRDPPGLLHLRPGGKVPQPLLSAPHVKGEYKR